MAWILNAAAMIMNESQVNYIAVDCTNGTIAVSYDGSTFTLTAFALPLSGSGGVFSGPIPFNPVGNEWLYRDYSGGKLYRIKRDGTGLTTTAANLSAAGTSYGGLGFKTSNNTLMTGGRGSGSNPSIFITSNFGTSWSESQPGGAADYFQSIGYDPVTNKWYAFFNGPSLGVWYSSNDGSTWTAATGLSGNGSTAVTPQMLWAQNSVVLCNAGSAGSGKIFYSSNGTSFSLITTGLAAGDVAAITYDSITGNWIIASNAGSGNVIGHSSVPGTSWTVGTSPSSHLNGVSGGMSDGKGNSFIFGTNQAGNAYACKSTNGGVAWADLINPGPFSGSSAVIAMGTSFLTV